MSSYKDDDAETKPARGRLEFVGGAGDDVPEVQIALVAPTGDRQEIELSEGEFSLDEDFVGKSYQVEIGPCEGAEPRMFRFDDLFRTVARNGVHRISEPTWRGWIFRDTCVTGRVRVCTHRPLFDVATAKVDRFTNLKTTLAPKLYHPMRCAPVCHGKVEVFVKTCCCPIVFDPPVVIKHICEIIDCNIIEWPPIEWPPKGGPIGPPIGPDPIGPDPIVESIGFPVIDAVEAHEGPSNDILAALEPAVIRAVKRVEAHEGGHDAEQIVSLARHLSALVTLEPAHQLEYIELYPDLRYLHCSCTTHRVAEVPLQSDGHFDACFPLGWTRLGCSRRVQYRVSQYEGGAWTVVYDDVAAGRSHALGDDAVLTASSTARSCGEQTWPGGKPWATLERIGSTPPYALIHSTNQNGEKTYAGALQARDGLVNPAPAGPLLPTAGPYDQPWAQTLGLYYGFHPGLKALGAKFFRTRVVRVSNTGTEISSFTLTNPVAWEKYFQTPATPTEPAGVATRSVPLNDSSTGVEGLYLIPYPDLAWPWIGGYMHAYVNTTDPRMPNGKYTFVLDLFDATGKRLVPDTAGQAPAPGEVGPVAFDLRRLTGPPVFPAPPGPTSLSVVVAQKALATLFHVDNLPTYGDIEQIRHNNSVSDTNCQFLAGPGSDTLRLRYSAYQANGYQWYHHVQVKQGLTGPQTTLALSNANVFSGDTAPQTFAALLTGEQRCAFAATLSVTARHTNGSGRIQAFDRSDIAAFALENTTP